MKNSTQPMVKNIQIIAGIQRTAKTSPIPPAIRVAVTAEPDT